MNVVACDTFPVPLPETHRFPMDKYRLLRERIAKHRNILTHVPPAATDQQILTTHSLDYLERLKSGRLERSQVRRLGFPFSAELLERSRRSVGGTIAACSAALVEGVSANLAGGTHHAFYDQPEGYCVLNDSVIALRCLINEGRIGKALVVDCDVHQGNGTAALTRDDPSIVTFSIHGEKNFPFRKEPSDYDIALPDGTTDDPYLEKLQGFLEDTAAKISPDLVIYLSGADPFEGDRLGRLALTKEGLACRDALVLGYFATRGIPVAVTMGGGYAAQVGDIVDIHEQTVLTALSSHGRWCRP